MCSSSNSHTGCQSSLRLTLVFHRGGWIWLLSFGPAVGSHVVCIMDSATLLSALYLNSVSVRNFRVPSTGLQRTAPVSTCNLGGGILHTASPSSHVHPPPEIDLCPCSADGSPPVVFVDERLYLVWSSTFTGVGSRVREEINTRD